MKLATGDISTLYRSVEFWYSRSRITLDINKKRLYKLKYNWRTRLCKIISSDYDGKDKKSFVSDRNLNPNVLGVTDNSIFVMKKDEARILMINETDSNLSRNITIENSDYFDLIVLNNNFHHTNGKLT